MKKYHWRIIGLAAGAVVGLTLLGWLVGRRIDVDADDVLGERYESPAPTADGTLPFLAEEPMPEFRDIASWLNGGALTAKELRGKVVLIDFWTYSCVNCIRTLPYLVAWHERYADDGLAIVGVHTPEFAFEKDEANVAKAIARHGIKYPVALDNDYGTWNAYGNRFWPAKYLFDADGRLRYVHFGEGEYEETEAAIQALLAERGVVAESGGVDVAAEDIAYEKIGTRETYIGYGRAESNASPEEAVHDDVRTYTVPSSLPEDKFALEGSWLIAEEHAEARSRAAAFVMRYDADTVNLVAGAASPVVAEITLDGAPLPQAFLGADAYIEDGRTYVRFGEERLYNLIDARGAYGKHEFRLEFPSPGARLYALTFG